MVIVSGGAQGIGAAIGRRLVSEGATVVVGDVLTGQTDEQHWTSLSPVEFEVGPVSGLVNNAGVVRAGTIETLSEADFRGVTEVNQLGVFLGMKQALPAHSRLHRLQMGRAWDDEDRRTRVRPRWGAGELAASGHRRQRHDR